MPVRKIVCRVVMRFVSLLLDNGIKPLYGDEQLLHSCPLVHYGGKCSWTGFYSG